MGLFNSILGNASQVNINEIKAQFENVEKTGNDSNGLFKDSEDRTI